MESTNKDKKKRIKKYLMVLAGCMLLVGTWISLRMSETAMAKPVDILFDVDVTGDMFLVGTFDQDGNIQPGPAEGRAGRTNVVVNRPSPAIQMDFMAELPCFSAGDIYSHDGGGTIDIGMSNKHADQMTYFFRANGKDGTEFHYRLDGDATIVGDNGGDYPTGDTAYTVTVTNLRVSQDTGKRGNACEGSFPGATATIRLVRK
jgi:hypothetical protein